MVLLDAGPVLRFDRQQQAYVEVPEEGEGAFPGHHHFKYLLIGVKGRNGSLDVDLSTPGEFGVISGSWNPSRFSFAAGMDSVVYNRRRSTVLAHVENFRGAWARLSRIHARAEEPAAVVPLVITTPLPGAAAVVPAAGAPAPQSPAAREAAAVPKASTLALETDRSDAGDGTAADNASVQGRKAASEREMELERDVDELRAQLVHNKEDELRRLKEENQELKERRLTRSPARGITGGAQPGIRMYTDMRIAPWTDDIEDP